MRQDAYRNNFPLSLVRLGALQALAPAMPPVRHEMSGSASDACPVNPHAAIQGIHNMSAKTTANIVHVASVAQTLPRYILLTYEFTLG